MDLSDDRTKQFASLLPGVLLAVLCWPIGTLAGTPCPAESASLVQVGSQRFDVDVAGSVPARERGLSGRASLPADAGMWFVMPAPGLHGFWMKDMGFPIDLVWIGPDRVVLGAERLSPCGANACPIHYPPAPVAYVLEVNAGRFAGKPGDRADWLCPP
jgi:uncharacterized membrane protein (UPF0127 family)